MEEVTIQATTTRRMAPDGRTTGAMRAEEVGYGCWGRPESGVLTGVASPMNLVIVLLP